MVRHRLFWCVGVTALLAAAACSSSTPTSPLAPSAIAGGLTNAEGDVTLKANAPTLVSPGDGAIFEATDGITLELRAGTARFVSVALQQEVRLARTDGTSVIANLYGPTTSTVSINVPPLAAGDYEWQARAALETGRGPWSALRRFTVKPAAGPVVAAGKRTPDPPPGARLPAPNMFHVVIGVANQYPQYLFNSCQEHGGNWNFMDTLVDALRLEDTRWGYAWKRGVVGDPLLDIVSYNWSSNPDEGTRNIYTIDTLLGHCGSSPSPAWINTQPDGGPGLSAWTGRGRF